MTNQLKEFENEKKNMISYIKNHANDQNESLPINVWDYFLWPLTIYTILGFFISMYICVEYTTIPEELHSFIIFFFMALIQIITIPGTMYLILFLYCDVPIKLKVIYKNESVQVFWKENPYERVNLYIEKQGKKLIVYDRNSLLNNKYQYKVNTSKATLRAILVNLIKNKYISDKDIENQISEKLKTMEIDFSEELKQNEIDIKRQKEIDEKLKYLNS